MFRAALIALVVSSGHLSLVPVLRLGPELQQETDAADYRALGCGPQEERHNIIKHKEHPTPDASSGKSLVYIMWAGTIKKLPTSRLGINGAWVATINDGMYSFAEVEPGILSFCWLGVPASMSVTRIARPSPTSVFRLTSEPGQTYYLEGGIQFGGNPVIQQVDVARAKTLLPKLTYATMEKKS